MLRIGLVGCGRAARAHAPRIAAAGEARIVGLADMDPSAAEGLAALLPAGEETPRVYPGHETMLAEAGLNALVVFTPHRSHYRVATDGLQAGCHVFVERPLSTNAQEASDLVSLARARGLQLAVGQQYRLRPSLIEARRLLAEGRIGPLRMVVASMAAPWLDRHRGPADAWRRDLRAGATGMLSDTGDHLIDALLWTTGLTASEVAAFQTKVEGGLDAVTAAAIRLSDGTPATLGVSALSPDEGFELTFYGEAGHVRVTERRLTLAVSGASPETTEPEGEPPSVDADFVRAVASEGAFEPCCPAHAALDTVRLLEAITRSAVSGLVEKL